MPPTRRNEGCLLARVNFPLYAVKMLTNRHIIVAGGGGSSNTGVANGFEIFELSHNGDRYVAEEIIRHETGMNVVMNCACYSNGQRNYFVAGQESHSQLYDLHVKVVDDNKEEDNKLQSVQQRQYSNQTQKCEEVKSKENINSCSFKHLKFEIKPFDSIKTDFSKDEPFQRVVCIGHSGKIMVTGGTDGHIRLWIFPSLQKKVDIAGHTNEIDDVDISSDEKTLVSVAKDGCAILWNSNTGSKICELQWVTPNNAKYLYKRCRFGVAEGLNNKVFTISNPTQRHTKLKSYLHLWDPTNFTLKKSASCSELLSALAVSDDGKFVAIGTMSTGSVSIYIAFSLQRVLQVDHAHTMFVTGLEFLPITSDTMLTNKIEMAVVSISVDNRVCIHNLSYRSTIPYWLAIVFIVITLFVALTFCSFLGL